MFQKSWILLSEQEFVENFVIYMEPENGDIYKTEVR
jgi:hypothetical protein